MVSYLKVVWQRRHFIVAYATARNVSMYTEARLDQLWQVLAPLLNSAVYYLIFGVLFKANRGISNYTAYLVTGVFGGRVSSFAECSVIRPPADELKICPSGSPSSRTPPDDCIWHGPMVHDLAGGPVGVANNALLRDFAIPAVEAQPLGYLQAVLSGLALSVEWPQRPYPVRIRRRPLRPIRLTGSRRPGSMLPRVTAVVLLVFPIAIADSDYRYLLPVLPFACLAAGLALAPTLEAAAPVAEASLEKDQLPAEAPGGRIAHVVRGRRLGQLLRPDVVRRILSTGESAGRSRRAQVR